MIRVSRLSVTPVKGLALQHPEEVLLERFGVAENRRFYLVDREGNLFSGVRHGPLVQIGARFDPDRERLTLRFPDGRRVAGEVVLSDLLTTDFYGRPVTGRLVDGAWSDALSAYAAKPVRLVRAERPGDACDVHVATLVSEASVDELRRQAGREEAVDARRFRMLIGIEGCGPHEEDGWKDRQVRIGEAVLRMGGPVPRCAVTTQDPDTGIPDLDTLRVVKQYRGLRNGKAVDFGVYADVEQPGRVRVGDPVLPLGSS